MGFRATFFVSHRWMDDQENFMTWQEIAELHQMGFEIGNHTWTHGDFSSPRSAAHLHGELALVERELKKGGSASALDLCPPWGRFWSRGGGDFEEPGHLNWRGAGCSRK